MTKKKAEKKDVKEKKLLIAHQVCKDVQAVTVRAIKQKYFDQMRLARYATSEVCKVEILPDVGETPVCSRKDIEVLGNHGAFTICHNINTNEVFKCHCVDLLEIYMMLFMREDNDLSRRDADGKARELINSYPQIFTE